MAGIKQIQKRRNVAVATRKITKTMGMIAASKFRRAMDRADGATPYIHSISKLVTDLMSHTSFQHPLLEKREKIQKEILFLITSNQGFCGAYNSNVCKFTRKELESLQGTNSQTLFRISGKKGISFFKNLSFPCDRQYLDFADTAAYEPIEAIADEFIQLYSTQKVDRIRVVYTQFISSAQQRTSIATLLPFTLDKSELSAEKKTGADFLYEPSPQEILEELLPQAVKAKFFKYFLDAVASEHVSRMVAMKSATDNANKMIKQLTQLYNRARQSKITMELLEIMAGAEAIK
jgi:F-type H+-transporting ATPase subunit gamma